MFASIFNFLDKIITDFSWRRLITFITFFLIIGATIFIAESYTNYLALNKLEKEIMLLKEISQIKTKIDNDSTLINIYEGLTKDLAHLVNRRSNFPSINSYVLRFLVGSVPWILMTLAFIPGFKRGDTQSNTIVGGIIFIIIFGGLGLLIPTSWGSTVHYIVYPIGSFLIVMSILMILQSKKNKNK